MRCAGYDRVDLAACAAHNIRVVRVPTYSPTSVAEHAVALMFCLNRHLHQAHPRVQMGNYSLSGLVGFEMRGKTVGVVGTGNIGREACRILAAIGCKVSNRSPPRPAWPRCMQCCSPRPRLGKNSRDHHDSSLGSDAHPEIHSNAAAAAAAAPAAASSLLLLPLPSPRCCILLSAAAGGCPLAFPAGGCPTRCWRTTCAWTPP